MSEKVTLFYIHDPMCSWCWGYRPTWQQLQQSLPASIGVEYVLGGLAPDSDESMPQELQNTIQAHWRNIQSKLGAEFNFDFWQQCQPRRSTYPACRAVIAAKLQGHEMQMIERIQRAYYLQAMNPSDVSTLTNLASELGLNEAKFTHDMNSVEVEQELQQQVQFVRNSPNRGFPGLLLQVEKVIVPIQVNYIDAAETIGLIENCIEFNTTNSAD